MNENGAGLKRISDWHDTIAFGWISNKHLFIWGSHYCSANVFDPFIYEAGKSGWVDVTKYVAPEPRIDFTQQRKTKYIPSRAIRIKYVSKTQVRDYIIKGESPETFYQNKNYPRRLYELRERK